MRADDTPGAAPSRDDAAVPDEEPRTEAARDGDPLPDESHARDDAGGVRTRGGEVDASRAADGADALPFLDCDFAEAAVEAAPAPPAPEVPPVVEVRTLDWDAVRASADPEAVRSRGPAIVARAESLLAGEGPPGLLFDDYREDGDDRAIRVGHLDASTPLWFIGDLHGDLLALEAAVALAREASPDLPPHLVFLGDLFDDGGHGLEVLLRVLELVTAAPGATCVLAGNHDEALAFDGTRFTASVSPSDFADLLNASREEWVRRAGALAVRLFATAPRALFLPDGLLVAHGGFPLVDLHAELEASGNWNDPRALLDFVWTRAHPKARRKMPNRSSRGSQFGHEDFADFCALAARLGRPVTHMVRGHDHVEERWAVYPAYEATPILTTNAMSRRLEREVFGPYVRVPTVARWMPRALPQVHELHVPEAHVRELYPEDADGAREAPEDEPPTDQEPAP